MEKISAVYQIINNITGKRYVGSSKNVKRRWNEHRGSYVWRTQPNNPLYLDMQKYGVDNFRFQILCPVEPEHLKEVEQEMIEMIQPKYNKIRANGPDIERYNAREKTDKRKEYHRKQAKSEKCQHYQKSYKNRICMYKGEEITVNALTQRFCKLGIEHPTIEALKYLKGETKWTETN